MSKHRESVQEHKKNKIEFTDFRVVNRFFNFIFLFIYFPPQSNVVLVPYMYMLHSRTSLYNLVASNLMLLDCKTWLYNVVIEIFLERANGFPIYFYLKSLRRISNRHYLLNWHLLLILLLFHSCKTSGKARNIKIIL